MPSPWSVIGAPRWSRPPRGGRRNMVGASGGIVAGRGPPASPSWRISSAAPDALPLFLRCLRHSRGDRRPAGCDRWHRDCPSCGPGRHVASRRHAKGPPPFPPRLVRPTADTAPRITFDPWTMIDSAFPSRRVSARGLSDVTTTSSLTCGTRPGHGAASARRDHRRRLRAAVAVPHLPPAANAPVAVPPGEQGRRRYNPVHQGPSGWDGAFSSRVGAGAESTCSRGVAGTSSEPEG